jgi:hypothetical protein
MDHIKAYRYLQDTGFWPDNFVPKNMFMEPGWQGILAFKITNEWIKYKLR